MAITAELTGTFAVAVTIGVAAAVDADLVVRTLKVGLTIGIITLDTRHQAGAIDALRDAQTTFEQAIGVAFDKSTIFTFNTVGAGRIALGLCGGIQQKALR